MVPLNERAVGRLRRVCSRRLNVVDAIRWRRTSVFVGKQPEAVTEFVKYELENVRMCRGDSNRSARPAVFSVVDDPEITSLRFYRPVWNGTDYELKPLTNVPTR